MPGGGIAGVPPSFFFLNASRADGRMRSTERQATVHFHTNLRNTFKPLPFRFTCRQAAWIFLGSRVAGAQPMRGEFEGVSPRMILLTGVVAEQRLPDGSQAMSDA